MRLDLLENSTSNGAGQAREFQGGELELVCGGVFDGAKVHWEAQSQDNGNNYSGEFQPYLKNLKGDIIQQEGAGRIVVLECKFPVRIRAVITNAGTNTNINCFGDYLARTKKY